MAGLNSSEVVEALSLIKEINDRGITILMIEHIMHAIMGVSDRIIVLHYGRKLAEGTPEEISKNKEVIEVYLGE
jgi:branched-chain amino acid transport system ATP-binding protein